MQPIIDDVTLHGDQAVLQYTSQFDNIDLTQTTISPSEIEVTLSEEVKQAIDVAYSNIERFHKAQSEEDLIIETMLWVTCKKVTPH